MLIAFLCFHVYVYQLSMLFESLVEFKSSLHCIDIYDKDRSTCEHGCPPQFQLVFPRQHSYIYRPSLVQLPQQYKLNLTNNMLTIYLILYKSEIMGLKLHYLKRAKIFNSVRNVWVIFLQQNLGGFFNIGNLPLPETNRVDQLTKFFIRCVWNALQLKLLGRKKFRLFRRGLHKLCYYKNNFTQKC